MSRRFELWEYAHDGDGKPVEDATLEFFDGGSAFGSAKDVFSDASLTTPIEQPIKSDAAGRWPDIFCDSALYDVRCTVGNVILTRTNYDPGLGAGFGVSSVVGVPQGGTGASNAAAARTNLGAASSSALTTVQNTVTEHDTLIDTGLHSDGDRFGNMASLDDVEVDSLASGFGRVCIQRVVNSTPVDSTIDASFPVDSTIPQIGEGIELFTQAFTPLRDDTLVAIRVEVTGESTGGAGGHVVLALFKNSTADAVRAAITTVANLNFVQANLSYEESPGATSAITYKARIGMTGTLFRVNGSGNTTLGGVMQSRMVIEEWVTK